MIVVFIVIACIFWVFSLWSYAVVLTTGPGTPEKVGLRNYLAHVRLAIKGT